LLRKVGEGVSGKDTIVLLKRGRHMGAIEEFLSAAEYVVRFGNPNIVLCPRGTIPTLEGYRSHPDESITPLLKERSWAPVVVDPSHAVGKATYVEACCLAAIAYGADGLCVETHIDPNRGIGDDPKQSVVPGKLKQIVERANAVWNLTRV
jgi:3-deoxy-7-phosphoheptulonate synthase